MGCLYHFLPLIAGLCAAFSVWSLGHIWGEPLTLFQIIAIAIGVMITNQLSMLYLKIDEYLNARKEHDR